VWAVDADAAFVRPGPRLVDGVEALAAIIHPDVAADAGRDDANEFGDDLHLVGGEGAAERPQQTRDG